jgi:hypothetical protein
MMRVGIRMDSRLHGNDNGLRVSTVIPAKGIVEEPCIEVLSHAGTSDVRAGLDCDEVAVVTCPQETVRVTGHTPRSGGSQDPSQLLTHI